MLGKIVGSSRYLRVSHRKYAKSWKVKHKITSTSVGAGLEE